MSITPLNESGQPVDWWFIYKVPKLAHDPSAGYGYAYHDPVGQQMQVPAHTLLDPASALSRTLQALFGNRSDSVGWILYNDELPDEVGRPDNDDLGHTKGVLGFDLATQSAFWLLHSWPKFASLGKSPKPSAQYGQTFLCLSLTLQTAEQIAALMIDHQQPQVYEPHLPAALDRQSPLYRLAQGADPSPKGDSEVISVRTTGGQDFKVLAKNRQWNQDFWNDLVGPALQDDMDVETWIRGAIASTQDDDGKHVVADIKQISLAWLRPGWVWPETSDHAKWGVTRQQPWVCVGDINRMVSQQKRGGGAVALQAPALWAELRKAEGRS